MENSAPNPQAAIAKVKWQAENQQAHNKHLIPASKLNEMYYVVTKKENHPLRRFIGCYVSSPLAENIAKLKAKATVIDGIYHISD